MLGSKYASVASVLDLGLFEDFYTGTRNTTGQVTRNDEVFYFDTTGLKSQSGLASEAELLFITHLLLSGSLEVVKLKI